MSKFVQYILGQVNLVSVPLCSKLVERMLAQEHELSSIEAATLTARRNSAQVAPITLANSPCDPPYPQDRGGCCGN